MSAIRSVYIVYNILMDVSYFILLIFEVARLLKDTYNTAFLSRGINVILSLTFNKGKTYLKQTYVDRVF